MVNGKILVATMVLVGMAGTCTAIPDMSNSGGGSWQYYKEITVKENSGSILLDYQVLVQLSGSNFPTNVRSDGADIRFTDSNGNDLSYWIESWEYAERNAKIWVKVTSISAGASTIIRMYYGNPSAASVSSGSSTFVFFDDFEDSNFGEWSIDPAATMISSSEQHYTGTRSLKYSVNLGASPMSYHSIPQGKYEIVAYIYDPGYGTFSTPCQYMAYTRADPPYLYAGIDNSYCSSEKNYYAYFDDGNNRATWGTRSQAWHKLQWVSDGSTVKMYIDDSLIHISAQSYLDRLGFYMYYWSGNGVGYGYFDTARIRKYSSPEVTLSLGAEQPVVSQTTVPPTTVPSTPTTIQTAEPENSAVLLHGEKTEVVLGEDVLLKLSAVNLIANPPMSVQVILYPPSGMSVTSSEFVKSGAGIYTTTYSLNPSEGKDIEVRIKTNQVGDFNVKGRIVYYFGDNKSSVEDHTLNLPIKVRKESAPTQNEGTSAQKQILGFEVITGISGLFFVLILKKSR